MSSLLSKTLVYLGLVDEDQHNTSAADLSSAGAEDSARTVVEPTSLERRVEPPSTSRAANRSQVRGERVGPVSVIRPVEVHSDVLLVEEFGDARILADRVRDRTPVVLDMRSAIRRSNNGSSLLLFPRN